jgi:hypothetical protein
MLARSTPAKHLDGIGPKAHAYSAAWSELARATSSDARVREKAARLSAMPGLDAVRTWASMPPLSELVAAQAAAQAEGVAAS